MRRFLQFLFTVAMGAALLYLFAGKHRQDKGGSSATPKEISKESSKEPAKETTPSPDSLTVLGPNVPRPEGAESEIVTDTASESASNSVSKGISDSDGARSTEAILSVIRKQTPTLKHVYNQALRTRPGMKGKLVFKLRIAPSGLLADVALVSSNTGDAAFDEAVEAKVETWRFKPVTGRNDDIVTVPFTFSE